MSRNPCLGTSGPRVRIRAGIILAVLAATNSLQAAGRIAAVFLAAVLSGFGAGCNAIVAADGVAHRDGPIFSKAAIATDHPVASDAGLEMLRRGGNAVDAAVAASFCLSVVRPYSCGIGGGGFMIIHLPPDDNHVNGRQIALNYRETAPAAVGSTYYVDRDDADASRFGAAAAGVPGTVAGLLYALDNFGTLDRKTVLEPAIRAAERGVIADRDHVAAAAHLRRMFDQHPERKALLGEIWSQVYRDGNLREGDIIYHPQQARALRLLAEQGTDAFYRGPIAEAIVAAMQAHDGPMTRDDLVGYEVAVMEPLRGRFLKYDVIGMPPPSSGGIAINTILGLIERISDELGQFDRRDASYLHALAESMKHAFADRTEWLADPAFVDVPIAWLTDPAYLDELAGRIDLHRTLEDRFAYGSVTPAAVEPSRNGGTSHLSVIDADGMAVACTETINLVHGSLLTVPGYGFALNNEMDDFTTIPGAPNAFGLRQSDRNLPEPGKRPLSSMSPTIVLSDGRAVLVAGASGGPRIVSSTAQVILNCLMFGDHPRQAIESPRLHHQWMPMSLFLEPELDAPDRRAALEARGHEIDNMASIGVVQAVAVDAEGIRAASDPRKGGEPRGY